MNDYSKYNVYQPTLKNAQPPSAKRKSYLFKPALIVGIILVAGFGGHSLWSAKAAARDSQRQASMRQQLDENKIAFSSSANSLIDNNSSITFSIATADLANNQIETLGSLSAMDAASTGKLITATLFLHKVEQEEHNLNEPINGSSAKDNLRLLINKSDDTAWETFNKILGHNTLTAYAAEIGITSYDPATNTIAAADMAKFMQKLYNGDLLNSKNTKLLLSFMQQTNHEEFISQALPSQYTIFHKVGIADDTVNDVAIIKKDNQAYVLVIYTNGNGRYQWNERAELMQKITKASLSAFIY